MTTLPRSKSLPSSERPSLFQQDDERTLLLNRDLRRLAVTLVSDEATAEDLVQEAWLAILDTGRKVRNPGAWLRRVLRNLASRGRRQAERRQEVEAFSAAPERVEVDASPVELRSSAECLLAAIEELREPYREVLRQRFLEERPIAEIAERSNRPMETVKSQVRRGIGDLRMALDRRHHGDRSAWVALLLPLALGSEIARTSGEANGSSPAPTPRSVRFFGPPAALVSCLVGAALLLFAWWGTAPDEKRWESSGEDTARRGFAVERVPAAPVPAPANGARRQAELPAVEAAPTPPARAVRSLEVSVLHTDGRPARTATARVWGLDARILGTYASDADGVIRIEVPESDLEGPPRVPTPHPGVGVMARAGGEAWSFIHNVGIPPAGRTIELTSGGPSQDVRGRVIDEFGEPVARAMVRLLPQVRGTRMTADGVPYVESRHRVETNAKGEFLLDGLPVRAHTMIVRGPDLLPETRLLDETQEVVEVEVALRYGGVVYGSIRDAEGRPVAGAEVWEVGLSADKRHGLPRCSTKEDGTFELLGVESGQRRLFARHPVVPNLMTSQVVDVNETYGAEWNGVLEETDGVRVRVEDEEGNPVQGAAVLLALPEVPFWSDYLISDAEGRVHFHHIPSGKMGLGIQHDGADPHQEISRREVEASPEEILVRLPERPFGSLRGSLVDECNLPVRNARIVVCATGDVIEATTNDHGEFHVEEAPEGPCRVWAVMENTGYVEVGDFELSSLFPVETGTTHAKLPLLVRMDWGTGGPSTDSPWLLEATGRCGELFGRTVAVLEEPAARLLLRPGPYRLRPARGEDRQRFDFKIPSSWDAKDTLRVP